MKVDGEEFKVGFLEYAPGMKSMGRLLALLMMLNGTAATVVGLVLIVIAFISKNTEAVGSLVGLVGLGIGVDVGASVMKNWAKGIEASEDVREARLTGTFRNTGAQNGEG